MSILQKMRQTKQKGRTKMIGRPRGTKTTKQCSNAKCKKYLSTNNNTGKCFACQNKEETKRLILKTQKIHRKL